MLKKLLSITICVVLVSMIFSSFVCAAAPSAPGGNVTSYDELVNALGGSGIGTLKYDSDGNVTHLHLVRDVTLDAPVVITSGSYTIIGEGAIIRANFDSGNFFELRGNETVLSLGNEAAVDPERIDLTFDGRSKTFEGSFVRVFEGAGLELYSGVLFEDLITTVSGAAVYNEGSFIMYGGIIENCKALGTGGAVYNGGEALLAFGRVAECSADLGGAVYNQGKISFLGTSFTANKASKGGFLYNAGEAIYVSSGVTECTASTDGGAIYNVSKLVFKGGKIEKCDATVKGGFLYNTGEATFEGGNIGNCKASNGGSIYNTSQLSISGETQLYAGRATSCGANVYNDTDATFNFIGGAIASGIGAYGGGVYNLGVFNMSGGGVFSNQATVAEGILNSGTFNLSGRGYVGDNDDIYILLSNEGKHALNIAADWSYASRKLNISCGVKNGSSYEYLENKGDLVINNTGDIDITDRFNLFNKDSKFVISNEGRLVEAPVRISSTVWLIIGICFAFAVTVTVIVFVIRYFDKKREGVIK